MPLLDLDLLHLRIVHSGRDWLGPWWNLRRVRGPAWVVYANDRDGARIMVGGRSWPLRAGRVLVIPPHVAYDTAPGREVRQVFFHVDVLGLPAAAAAELLPAPLDLGQDPVLAAQAERLHALMPERTAPQPDQPPQPSLPLHGLAFVHQVFARLLDCSPQAQRVAWSTRLQAHGPLARALHHIDRNLGRPLYVAQLAAMCGMGQQWFSARFKAATGRTPAQYILERRATVAMQRLAFSDEPIDAIATSCGFSDRAHFTKVFTAKRGIAPGAYRRQERRRPIVP